MKYFTPAIDKYFAAWILPETWYTDLDIENFYRFVIAINHFSKPIKHKLDLDDPCLSKYQKRLRPKMAKILAVSEPNPRTYDEKALKQKILLAVKRNHPDFDETYATELIEEYVEKAMIILEALRAVKRMGFPDINIQRWKPPLK